MDKIRTGQFLINDEAKQITFTDVRFYTVDGENFFPSVTTILDAYPKTAQFYDWLKKNGEEADSIRDAAAERGSIVHQLTERYDDGETISLLDADGSIRFKAAEWAQFEKYVEFSETVKPEILMNEFNIVSPELGTAGTIDRKLVIPKIGTCLLDIKTSNALHPHYWSQLAAYAKLNNVAYPDENIDNVCILWLNAKTRGEGKKGSFQGKGWQLVFPDRDIEHYWNIFKATQMLWNEVNSGLKPRNIVYNLEHKKE